MILPVTLLLLLFSASFLASALLQPMVRRQCHVFLPTHHHQTTSLDLSSSFRRFGLAMAPARYGPPLEQEANNDTATTTSATPVSNNDNDNLQQFRHLIHGILNATNPDHIPSLLTQNMDVLLTATSSLTGNAGTDMMQSLLEEARAQGGDERAAKVQEAIDLTLSFAEQFVEHASQIDHNNKELLGKILRIMSSSSSSSSMDSENDDDDIPTTRSAINTMTHRQREQALDELLIQERDKLTAGFVRHLEAECLRVRSAPTLTPNSARLLETLHMIQARVVEELGRDLGEAAQVLGQLIGYNTAAERRAVLDAGLTVRGVVFAHELKALTEEALEGFATIVSGKADPELVAIVQELDDRLARYIEDHSEFE